ncbi:MAG: hypothetical protein QGG15_00850 [Dehalococcoidales bacterium]|nr:hypothetical protein [Dehalococcoidales bacterium]MDP6737570.1 hypothetical protein [Dehalococcoidales bacterium]
MTFGVGFDVDGGPRLTTTHHTDCVFLKKSTVPNDMRHYGTVLLPRDYETAALPLNYAGML